MGTVTEEDFLVTAGSVIWSQFTVMTTVRLSNVPQGDFTKVTSQIDIKPPSSYNSHIIKSWVDAHTNLPFGARWFAKADVARQSNQAASVNPPSQNGGFFVF